MQKGSFKIISTFVLFFFLVTPMSALAQVNNGNGLAQGILLGSLLSNQDGNGQNNTGLLTALALSGGLGGRGGLGGGAGGQLGQSLTLLGALTGNMGLLIAGMLSSMLGGLAGGSTPQQTAVDEQYVGQGQGYGTTNGTGANNPYYPTPTPATQPPVAACTASMFIVKDTTVTPNVTKPYPAASSVAKNGCVLAINADAASHVMELKKKNNVDYVAADRFTTIGGTQSHTFRFSASGTYSFCVDSSASACTTVTVQ